MRPNGAAYARVAYARELKGNLRGALEAMQMAVQSTTPTIPKRRRGTTAHVGEIHLRMGRLDEANREFGRAAFIFPDYPFARIGQGESAGASRRPAGAALAIFLINFKRTPTLDLAARIGDLHASGGDTTRGRALLSARRRSRRTGCGANGSRARAVSRRTRSQAAGRREDRGDARQGTARYLHGRCARVEPTTKRADWTKPCRHRKGLSEQARVTRNSWRAPAPFALPSIGAHAASSPTTTEEADLQHGGTEQHRLRAWAHKKQQRPKISRAFNTPRSCILVSAVPVWAAYAAHEVDAPH